MNYKRTLLGFTLTFSIILEFCVRYFDLWNTIPYCDKLMHFFWGVNIFLILVIGLKWKPKDALIGIFVWQMFWELGEMLNDIVIPQADYMLDYFYFDGIKDTLVDLAGGLFGWLLIFKAKKEKLRAYLNMKLVYLFSICIAIVIIIGGILSIKAGYSKNFFAIYGISASIILTGLYYFVFVRKTRK